MAEIQTVYVRIRPDARGFRGEATRQLRPQLAGVASEARRLSGSTKDATDNLARFTRGTVAANAAAVGLTRAVGFASTAFIGGIGLGAAIRTATDEFTENVRVSSAVAAGIKSTGGVANVTAREIDALADRTLRLTGLDDELVKQGASVLLTFRRVRNEVGAGNAIFDRAVESTADLAQRFRTDLGSEAIRLGRALEDPVRGITALRRAGITFTSAQQKTIKGLVETGQLLQAQKLILDEVETQVGGTAEAFGRTLPGQLRRMREETVNSMGELVKRLTESEQAAAIATQGIADLRDVARTAGTAISTIGPPLLDLATLARGVVDSLGVPTLVAAFAAYKSVGLITRIATGAQAFYAKTVAASVIPIRAATVANTGLATSVFAVGVNTGRATAATGIRAFGAGLLQTVGKANLLTAAAVATAAAVVYLRQRTTELERANIRSAASFRLLDGELARSRDLRRQLSDATGAIETDRASVATARLAVAQSQQALASETAAKGSINYRVAQLRVAEALEDLRQSEERLQQDQNKAARAEAGLVAAADLRHQVAQRQVADAKELIRVSRVTPPGTSADALRRVQRTGPQTIRATSEAFREQAEELGGMATSAGRASLAMAALTQELGRVPTEKEIQIIVEASGAGKTLGEILKLLGLIKQASAGLNAATRVEDIRADVQNRVDGIAASAALIRAEKAKANVELAASTKALRNVREIRRERARALREQTDALNQERESLRAARQAVLDAQTALADAIRTGNQAVTDAVQSAKQNLNSIGGSLAAAVRDFLDKTEEGSAPTGAIAKRLQELRKQILEGRGGPETIRAAQEITARLRAQETKAPSEDLERRFTDVTSLFNRGAISLATFNKRINALLAGLGVTEQRVRRTRGQAAGDEIHALIVGIRQQAGAIAQGPQRPGAGVEVSIVRPLQTLRESQQRIADAQKQLAQAHLEVSRATKRVHEQQLAAQRATYSVLAAERAEARAGRRLERAQLALIERNTRPRGKGGGGSAIESSRDMSRVGGNPP